MTNARDSRRRTGIVFGCALALSLGAYACGGSDKSSKTPDVMSKEIAGVAADDRSRCDFKGRGDREVVESLGPGARTPNIRRVYGVAGEGEDRVDQVRFGGVLKQIPTSARSRCPQNVTLIGMHA